MTRDDWATRVGLVIGVEVQHFQLGGGLGYNKTENKKQLTRLSNGRHRCINYTVNVSVRERRAMEGSGTKNEVEVRGDEEGVDLGVLRLNLL